VKTLKKILAFLPFVIFVIAVVLIINISISIKSHKVPKVLGYSYMIVETGSMKPNLEINDFIVVKEKDDYQVDDVVSFYYDLNGDDIKEVVTHRIKIKDNNHFVVKGDNDEGTQEVSKENIIGKVVYKSSFLGSIFTLKIFSNKNIIFGVLVALLLAFAIYQIINIIKMTEKGKDKGSQD